MIDKKVTAVIFEGGKPSSEIEHDLVKLRQAMVLDNVERFLQVDEIDKVIVATNYPELKKALQDKNVVVDFDFGVYHFGTRLKNIINKYNLTSVFYIGGAAGPLLTVKEMSDFSKQVLENPGMVLTNNVQSADLMVFSPADIINKLPHLPQSDNPLANMLRNVGLNKVLMPHSTGIHFDIDTPTDMLVLSIHPALGKHTKQAFKHIQYDSSHLIKAKYTLAVPYTDVLMSGRIGSPVITQLNTNVRCRLRVYSEERGMKSLGRMQKNMVTSLLGHLMELKGEQEFFNYLASLAKVAFIDTRVLFAHKKMHLSDNDRFYADLLMPEKIENEWARQFTMAVKNAPIPIVVGGHSLVAGGMWAIIDTLLYEDKLRYSKNKLYSIIIPNSLKNKEFAAILKTMPAKTQVYGLTRNSTPEHRAFTFLNPRPNQIVEEGWKMHVAAPINTIKKMENNGWQLEFTK
ncbi:hypothetical protein IMX26_09250 [Clostridium sp. 'deep sea']|uniref:hypothetical protein n=1 Tax=Clostridium sp. 'deep sea' TaxID=2779445 RepID=UPI001896953F|nr:hypothetical protein [Clostridium sp. 'deep sea']QOR33688.1 hypothetical protein IMX26_09250 [Clostridium sp. 'deep sea']